MIQPREDVKSRSLLQTMALIILLWAFCEQLFVCEWGMEEEREGGEGGREGGREGERVRERKSESLNWGSCFTYVIVYVYKLLYR